MNIYRQQPGTEFPAEVSRCQTANAPIENFHWMSLVLDYFEDCRFRVGLKPFMTFREYGMDTKCNNQIIDRRTGKKLCSAKR